MSAHTHSGLTPTDGRDAGFTLIEVLVSAVILSVVAAGLMAATVAAARVTRSEGHAASAEASAYATQGVERFRNMIACGEGNTGEWFTDDGTCTPILGPGNMPNTWQTLNLSGVNTSSESIQNLGGGAARRYCVSPRDCDGDTVVGDCFAMHVRICWDEDVGSCPAVGGACPP